MGRRQREDLGEEGRQKRQAEELDEEAETDRGGRAGERAEVSYNFV